MVCHGIFLMAHWKENIGTAFSSVLPHERSVVRVKVYDAVHTGSVDAL